MKVRRHVPAPVPQRKKLQIPLERRPWGSHSRSEKSKSLPLPDNKPLFSGRSAHTRPLDSQSFVIIDAKYKGKINIRLQMLYQESCPWTGNVLLYICFFFFTIEMAESVWGRERQIKLRPRSEQESSKEPDGCESEATNKRLIMCLGQTFK